MLGQERATQLFRRHLAEETVAHAYLLAGPDGVGKRRLALEMAKALNCAGTGVVPCDTCSSCSRMARGVHPDLHVLSPGGASEQIKIEEIRALLGRIALRPFHARFQVVILDGADRLTDEAANSLLKALEEPPAHTRFLLTTARLAFCLPTIVSRCQLVRCVRVAANEPTLAPDLARRLADTSAASWLEQPLPETRDDVAQWLEAMVAWLRDVAVASAGAPSRIAHTAHAEAVRRQADAADADRCVAAAMELLALRESLDQFVSPRLVASLAREQWLSLHEVNTHK